MAKWLVTIEEKLTYNLEVDADSYEEAENKAWNSSKYINNECDDCDGEITQITEVAKEKPKYFMQTDDKHFINLFLTEGNEFVAQFVSADDAVEYVRMKEGR